ncbi:MAG TPA: four helix bundle protein [Cyclobacteriaceae bacterium]
MEEGDWIYDESNFGVDDTPTSYNSRKDFTTLEAWKKCRLVRQFFYEGVIPSLPSEERYNLDIQIRKAAVSVTANIAEGYGRYHFQEGIQFYRVARGSLYELKDHLIACQDMRYIESSTFERGISLIEDAKITLNGFINYIRNQKPSN